MQMILLKSFFSRSEFSQVSSHQSFRHHSFRKSQFDRICSDPSFMDESFSQIRVLPDQNCSDESFTIQSLWYFLNIDSKNTFDQFEILFLASHIPKGAYNKHGVWIGWSEVSAWCGPMNILTSTTSPLKPQTSHLGFPVLRNIWSAF